MKKRFAAVFFMAGVLSLSTLMGSAQETESAVDEVTEAAEDGSSVRSSIDQIRDKFKNAKSEAAALESDVIELGEPGEEQEFGNPTAGTKEAPLAIGDVGEISIYDSHTGDYEKVQMCVTGVTGGEEAEKYVYEMVNSDETYRFGLLRDGEEYRVVDYDIHIPEDSEGFVDGAYGVNGYFSVLGADGNWIEIDGRSVFPDTYTIYTDGVFQKGDTAHCRAVMIIPKEITEYQLDFISSDDTPEVFVKID